MRFTTALLTAALISTLPGIAPLARADEPMPVLPALADFGGEDDAILLRDPDRAYAEAAARLAAHYIAGALQADGSFAYEFDFLRSSWSEQDNIVRQAGAISVLGTYLDRLGRDPEVEQALVAAMDRMQGLSIPFGDGSLISDNGALDGAETGATALALNGELLFAAVTGDQQFAGIRSAWLEGLRAVWDPERGMRRSPVSPVRSPYFDGETWLAAATFASLHPDDETAEMFARSLDTALMAHYGKDPNPSFFHWGALASRVRFDATGDPAFVEFSAGQAIVFRRDMRPYINHLNNTCYSIEGLAATWWVLESGPAFAEFRAETRNRILNEQHKNAEMQIRPGQTTFEPVPGTSFSSDRMPEFAGAYLNGRHRLKTRIDTTQHCLNAWLQMLR